MVRDSSIAKLDLSPEQACGKPVIAFGRGGAASLYR